MQKSLNSSREVKMGIRLETEFGGKQERERKNILEKGIISGIGKSGSIPFPIVNFRCQMYFGRGADHYFFCYIIQQMKIVLCKRMKNKNFFSYCLKYVHIYIYITQMYALIDGNLIVPFFFLGHVYSTDTLEEKHPKPSQ